MNYLNLLRELAEQYVVKMESVGVNGDWQVLVGRHKLLPEYPLCDVEVIGFEVMAQGKGKTPEEAIRMAYLLVNPIPRARPSGKLTQG